MRFDIRRCIFRATTPPNMAVMASAGEIMVRGDYRRDWEGGKGTDS